MSIYQKHNASEVKVKNFDMEEDNEDHEIQKPQIKNATDEEHNINFRFVDE